jgi:hypothetical protein
MSQFAQALREHGIKIRVRNAMRRIWILACKADGIDPENKAVLFSKPVAIQCNKRQSAVLEAAHRIL